VPDFNTLAQSISILAPSINDSREETGYCYSVIQQNASSMKYKNTFSILAAFVMAHSAYPALTLADFSVNNSDGTISGTISGTVSELGTSANNNLYIGQA
jgi:hypothetical protein